MNPTAAILLLLMYHVIHPALAWSSTHLVLPMQSPPLPTASCNILQPDDFETSVLMLAAWENPATMKIKSMATAALWGAPLALFLLVAVTAVFFSTIMPVIDKMFYSTLEEEMKAYLPDLWQEYQNELNATGDVLSARKDMQMLMWDDLAEFKSGKLREMYLSRLGENSSAKGGSEYYQSLWDQASALLEEGEELENRPDLIAMLEEGILKRPRQDGDDSTSAEEATLSESGFNSIVGNELNRVDLIMRLFDKTTEFTGKSRQQIYKDWDDAHKL